MKHHEPTARLINVIGVDEDNIGEAIYNTLGATQSTMKNSYLHNGVTDLILCNGLETSQWIGEQDTDEVKRIIYGNLTASIEYVNNFVKDTKNDPHIKRIILIGSLASTMVLNGSSAYCAAKAGLNQYAKCAAYELAKHGYLVHVINPGNVVDTPMTKRVIKTLESFHNLSPDEAAAYWSKVNNLGEFATRWDIANIVAFLLTPSARFLSGSAINMPGSNR
mgnify:CR=1 FL=1